jgi:hypothetical protein
LNGEAPFTYEWSNGATTASIDSLIEGTYSVVVTDANGCSGTCTAEVTVTPCCNVTDVCTDLDIIEIGFGTANARVNATWTNPNATTDCEVRGGRIAPSSIGTGTPLFTNISNTQVITQTDGSTILFNIVLYNNPLVAFKPGHTYGYEVRCLCEDESGYTNWSGMTPESTFIVPSPPALREDEFGDETKRMNGMDFSIYPNPNEGEELMIVLTGLNEEEGVVQLELLDVMGRLAQSERISAKGEQISHRMNFEEKLPRGIYMVRVIQETMTISKRLIIE